jgi:thioredoxin reductase (NADPH)
MMAESTGRNTPLVKIYGRLGSPEAYQLRDFLHRCDIPFEFIPLDSNARLPVAEFPDGTRMECPTIRQVTEKLGWFANPSRTEYDLAIYGAGPAGLSAAVYGSSDGLKTILIERWAVGGQAASSSKIENYLGFPGGISGAELAERARDQAVKFGTEVLLARKAVRGELTAGKGVCDLEDGTRIVAHASICATGVEYRRLGLPNEERFLGAGVYYGAGASEAALVKGEDVYIVGGGNSAGQAAMHFAAFARRIYIVIRGDSLKDTLSRYLLDRINSSPDIVVLPRTEVVALQGDKMLEEITLLDCVTGQKRSAKARWLFLCIGGVPHTDWAKEIGVVRDESGYLVTGPDLLRGRERPAGWPLEREPFYLETNLPGLFAAGDVRHGSVKRVASAVGEGAMAVAFVQRFLANR